jgi:hypothetical protein
MENRQYTGTEEQSCWEGGVRKDVESMENNSTGDKGLRTRNPLEMTVPQEGTFEPRLERSGREH